MIYVKSNIDNKYYLVRKCKDQQQAANMLSKLKQNTLILSENLYKNRDKYPDYKQYIDRLYEKAPDIIFIESNTDSEYTSYSVNKGEQIVFCIRTKQTGNDIHDLNLIMYVVLHELSHVACPIYDNHGPLFKKIFSFLCYVGIELNLYQKIDFKEQPVNYCGLMITESII